MESDVIGLHPGHWQEYAERWYGPGCVVTPLDPLPELGADSQIATSAAFRTPEDLCAPEYSSGGRRSWKSCDDRHPESAPVYDHFTVTYPSGTVVDAYYGDGATLDEVRVTHPLAVVEAVEHG